LQGSSLGECELHAGRRLHLAVLDEDVVLPSRGDAQQEPQAQAVGVERIERGDPQHILEEEGVDLHQQEDCHQAQALQQALGGPHHGPVEVVPRVRPELCQRAPCLQHGHSFRTSQDTKPGLGGGAAK